MVSNLWIVARISERWTSPSMWRKNHIRAFGSRFLDDATLLEADSFAHGEAIIVVAPF
jgi:hypothetical protein